MVNLELLGMLIFFSVVGLLIIIDRKNIKFYYGVVMRRWKFGPELIDKVVAKHGKLLYKIGDIAVCIGLVAGIIGIAGLIYSIVIRQEAMLVLPSAGGYEYPGPVLSVPFWYWLVAIFVIITVHEGMHALFARLAKIPIKEAGIITLLVFPIGAFVEPDMKKVKRLVFEEKLRIYAAGSFGNLLAAGVVFLIILSSTFLVESLVEKAGVRIGSTAAGMPAEAAGVSGILYRINDTDIKSISDLRDFMKNVSVGSELVLYTTEGIFKLKTVPNPENESLPYIGITNLTNAYLYKRIYTGYVGDAALNCINIWFNLIFWIFLLNLAVATINMLPLRPLDGGLMYEEILKKKFGRKGGKIMRSLETFVFGLLLFAVFGVYIIKQFI